MPFEDTPVKDQAVAAFMMEEIRARVRKKREMGEDVDQMDAILDVPLSLEALSSAMPYGFPEGISYLLKNYELKNDYHISSHRPLTGSVLIRARQLFNGEIRRYVDPVFSQQSTLNNHISRSLLVYESRMADLLDRVEALEKRAGKDAASPKNRYEGLPESLNLLNDRIDAMYQMISANEQASGAGPSRHDPPAMDMAAFTTEFGAAGDTLKGLYSDFLRYFEGCVNVLDVGCGRGFFLDLAEENGIQATGIDISSFAVEGCKAKGRQAVLSEGVSYLEILKDGSLDGIFVAHVVEHLSQPDLATLVANASRTLSSGSCLVIITPNITNVSVSSQSFYLDPTHRTHVHPYYLRFLLESHGLEVVETKYFQPTIPESVRLERLATENVVDPAVKGQLNRINANIDRLNEMLFGYRDLAMIARRP